MGTNLGALKRAVEGDAGKCRCQIRASQRLLFVVWPSLRPFREEAKRTDRLVERGVALHAYQRRLGVGDASQPIAVLLMVLVCSDVADELLKGATEYIKEHGAVFETISVPGTFEIPAAVSYAVRSGRYDGIVALGCVIRGETSHYDYVCLESARGLNDIAINEKAAIGYGILTVENKKQAILRASVHKGNKGAVAANACLEMIKLKHDLGL